MTESATDMSHLEVIGTLARMHLKPAKRDRDAAEANPLISIVGGGGVGLVNSMGVSWTADYLKISGQMKSFMLALQSLGKDPLEIGQIPPDPQFVNAPTSSC